MSEHKDIINKKLMKHVSLNTYGRFKSFKSLLEPNHDMLWNQYVSMFEFLTEDFLRIYSNMFTSSYGWENISKFQILSEDFIRDFKNNVSWSHICKYQKLSETFIREFKDYVNWNNISAYQLLSESFIREFKNDVDWRYICVNQTLSEEFIIEFQDYVYYTGIVDYQKVSEEFRNQFLRINHGLYLNDSHWLYKSKKDKLKYIKENTNYEIVDDEYIIAYKSVRQNRYSCYNFQYQYLDGETYSSHCDCNIENKNSFGLSAWTYDGAKDYYKEGKILKVQIAIDKIGVIVHNNEKIRCFEFLVLKEVSGFEKIYFSIIKPLLKNIKETLKIGVKTVF